MATTSKIRKKPPPRFKKPKKSRLGLWAAIALLVLVVGGQGGPTIIMGVLQAVVGTVDFGLDPARALDAARVDARAFARSGLPFLTAPALVLNVEDTRVAPSVLDELQRRGHLVQRAGEYAGSPGLNAVAADRRTGLNAAAGDPRQARAPRAQTR
jgi:gamma-glutamyltranspeptidase/glutathione hydrolase